VLKFPPARDDQQLPPPDPAREYLLYLHVPYCVVLCPFCSFHRVQFREQAAARYFDCLRQEVRIAADAGYCFANLYVGGGTPTVLPGELARTVEQVRDQHPLQSVSVETNPDDLEKDSVRHLRDSGVNRLSVGVQSFDDALLEQMQRLEKYGSGAMIVDRLRRSAGVFDTLNVDMIFNFPRQTEASLRRDLGLLTDEIGVDQVSWYPLMSAKSTRRSMRQHMGGDVDRSRERGFYELIAQHMLGAGYERSSSWCFSRQPGLFDEYIIEHDEYVGLGSGAFSYLRGQLLASTFSINHYCRLVDSGRSGVVQRRSLGERDQMRYYLLMKLFSGALDLGAAQERFSSRFRRVLWPELAALLAIGAARRDGGRLRLTDRGHFLWVVMMREFFAGVSDLRDAMRHHISEERFPSQDQ
jgi:coproporphyrinogen III oxidase-like Fe-S oxidoreductase